jgi:hypothetical protein
VRTGVALLLVLALAGCGAEVADERASAPAGEPATTIERIDEDAGAVVEAHFLELEKLAPVRGACIQEDAECEAEDVLDQDYRAWVESRRPAEGSTPRAIARLGDVRLVIWRTESGSLCALADGGDASRQGWTAYPPLTRIGPVCESEECGDVCLGLGTGSTLAGFVSARGDELRITFGDGERKTYPLTGPLVPGANDRRVFMLELPGRRFWHRLELLRAGETIAEAAGPSETVDPGFGEPPPPGVDGGEPLPAEPPGTDR